MSDKTYELRERLTVGKQGERDFKARHPGVADDASGGFKGDLVISATGERLELKTDAQGRETGNLFVELEMMDYRRGRRRSGVYQAIEHGCRYIVYQTLDTREFWFLPEHLRQLVENYRRQHGEMYRTVRNEDEDTGEPYWAGGVIMPMGVLEQIRIDSPLGG